MCEQKVRHNNGPLDASGRHKRRANGSGTLCSIKSRAKGSAGEIIGWLALWYVDVAGRKRRISKMIQRSEEVPDVEAARRRLNELTRLGQFHSAEAALLRVKDQLEGLRASKKSYLDSLPALKVEDGFELFKKTRAGRRPCEATLRSYEIQFHVFCQFLKKNFPSVTELRQVTRQIARAYSEHLLSIRTGSTHNRHLTFLNGMTKAIMRHEAELEDESPEVEGETRARIKENPWERIERADAVPQKRRDLSVEETRSLLSKAPDMFKKYLLLLAATGMRKSDALFFTWDHILLDKGLLKYRPRKTHRIFEKKDAWVFVPIIPDLYNAFVRTPVKNRVGFVFPDLVKRFGKSPSLLSYHITKVFKSCGIQTNGVYPNGRKSCLCNCHSFRHGLASIAASVKVENGGSPISLTSVASMLGHQSVDRSFYYTHVSPETLKEQMKAFPKLLEDADVIDVPST